MQVDSSGFNDALVSTDYSERYAQYQLYGPEEHTFFVFRRNVDRLTVRTAEGIELALRRGDIMRIAHHFTVGELKELFREADCIDERFQTVVSPNSGMTINTTTLIFRKP